jgi:hypothetical protein
MAKLLLKVFLLAIAVAAILWNLMWSKTVTIPVLSTISSTIVYAIAGIAVLIFVIVQYLTRKGRIR